MTDVCQNKLAVIEKEGHEDAETTLPDIPDGWPDSKSKDAAKELKEEEGKEEDATRKQACENHYDMDPLLTDSTTKVQCTQGASQGQDDDADKEGKENQHKQEWTKTHINTSPWRSHLKNLWNLSSSSSIALL